MVRMPKGAASSVSTGSVRDDIPQGTLELLILTIVRREPLHGYGISQRLAALTSGTFQVNPGSLFPALYAMERDGKLRCEERLSENNRKARYYRLTPLGRRHLEREEQRWQRVSVAIASVLEGA
jgi:PadR family transcriptional regulator